MHLAAPPSLHPSTYLGHHLSQGLDLLVKVLQLLSDHGPKDPLDLALLREGHGDQVEAALQTSGDDIAAPSRWAHGSHQEHVLYR